MDKSKEWSISSYRLNADGSRGKAIISEGINQYGDGPERQVATFDHYSDAVEVCMLHNASL